MSGRRAALVTGGSRGVGAATCRALAAAGFDVVLTYRNKQARAAALVAEIEALGGRALALRSDITDPADRDQLAEGLAGFAPGLDAVVLNASGGLEKDLVAADPEYPMLVNRDAQVALLNLLLFQLNQGAVVVHVTSHWAHLFGLIEQLPDYEPIAASKHAGEVALREMETRLMSRGATLAVVTGDLVEGTITARLLERRSAGVTGQARDRAGSLPTAEDLAAAIATVCVDGGARDTVVVGGSLESLLAPAAR